MKVSLLLLAMGALTAFSGPVLLAQYELPSGDCPNCRTIDWENNTAFVTGIPNYTQGINAVTEAGVDNTGASDTQVAINSAFNSISAGQYVYLPPGTYLTSGPIRIPPNKALVGAGMNQTIIANTGTSEVVEFQSGDGDAPARSMSPVQKGDTQIVVSDASGLSVGDVISIHMQEDNVLVEADGRNSCDWCGDEAGNYMGQFVEITAINGTTLTINRPAYYDYDTNPGFRPYIMPSGMGLSDLKILCMNDNGDASMVVIQDVQKSWVKNVEIEYAHDQFIFLSNCYGITVTGCYLHRATGYGSDDGYGIWIFAFNSDHYIYNNIVDWCRYGVNFEGGGAGCIVAYNYIKNVREGDDPTWLHAGVGFHGVHPFQNLIEGNMMPTFIADNTFGSSSHSVVFRNYLARESYVDFNITSGMFAVDLEMNSRYHSLVGNVVGYSGISGNYEENGCSGAPVLYRFGCESPGLPGHTDDAFNTTLRHGNYDYVNNSVVDWLSGESQDLPDSLYLSAKPSWWGGGTWPSIGPDVSGFVQDIPAKDRYEGEVVPGDGVPPAPPTNLRVVGQ